MKNLGWNDYVCAGIMGNLMAETGGQTLDLDPKAYSSNKNYYGICQWSKKYYAEVHKKDLEFQCDFLIIYATIQSSSAIILLQHWCEILVTNICG